MMDATALATDLYRKGLGNTWLSVKRTDWLRDLALRDHERDCQRAARKNELAPAPMYSNQVYGDLDLGAENIGHWTMRVSPVNGCGFFACTVSNVVDLQLKGRAAAVEYAVRQAYDRKFAPLYDAPEPATREQWIEAAHFLKWAHGYLVAGHEFGAWNEYEEAIDMVLAAWERSGAASVAA
jgi:hypothetical protein